MPLRSIPVLLLAALLLSAAARESAAAAPFRLGGDERLLVLAPHPGDETLGAGGLIQEALALDVPVRVCFFTMGDNNEIAYLFTRKHPDSMPGAMRSLGDRRQNEAAAAARQLGLSTNDVVYLGYPDYGTLAIWETHWRTVPPFRSVLTRATAVPYDRALTPGSAHAGEDILDDLEEVIRDFNPTHVLVSHPADHNVDHRALHLFARVALWNLAADGIAPEILAYPVHFTQWPEPRRYHPMRPASPPHFLDAGTGWLEYVLAPFQVSNKFAAIRRHHSQYRYASNYIDSLIRKSEIFAPILDLALPGGAGTADIDEEDASQFRPDGDLFGELSRLSEQWTAIAEQNAAETAALGDDDNDLLLCSVSGDGVSLALSFQFQKPISPATALSIHVFGYRADVPFGEMPKICVAATPKKILAVRDLKKKLPEDFVELVPGGSDAIALRVPYALLGDPEKILFGARLSKGTLPVDWAAWRALDLAGAPWPPPPPAAPAVEPPPPPAGPGPAPETAPPPPVEEPPAERPAAQTPAPLVPRVNLPKKPIPERTEADEPVMW
ncbi:MAG: PIG-L deacetylase family protein [Kiritimatiellia bacterium]